MNTPQQVTTAFQWPIRVYYEDTDAGGVVYHAAYLRFMERARTEWLRAFGLEQDQIRDEWGLLFVVRQLAIHFVQPARFNEELRVTVAVAHTKAASLEFEQTVLRANGGVCCQARVNIACVNAQSLRPQRIPSAFLDAWSTRIDG